MRPMVIQQSGTHSSLRKYCWRLPQTLGSFFLFPLRLSRSIRTSTHDVVAQ